MYIDLIDGCNLSCTTCVRSYKHIMPSTKRVMKIDLYKQIILKGINEGFSIVALYNWSEPFLINWTVKSSPN